MKYGKDHHIIENDGIQVSIDRLKRSNQIDMDKVNTILLDNISIKFIENYLRKKKLQKIK